MLKCVYSKLYFLLYVRFDLCHAIEGIPLTGAAYDLSVTSPKYYSDVTRVANIW